MTSPITVQCPHCNSQMKIRNAAALGRSAPCPRCGEKFVLEELPQDDEFDLGSLGEYGDVSDENADEEDDAPPPRSRKSSGTSRGKSGSKKKSSKKRRSTDWKTPLQLGGGILLGVTVLAGVVYGIMQLAGRVGIGGGGPEMAWLPDDTNVVLQLRVGDIMSSPVAQKLTSDAAISSQLNASTTDLGFSIQDIDRVTVGLPSMSSINSGASAQVRRTIVMSFKNPINDADWRQKVAQGRLGGLQSETHNGRTLHTMQEGAMKVAISFVDDRTVLIGSDADVRKSLDAGGKCAAASRFNWADGKAHVLFAFAPSDTKEFDSMGMTFSKRGPFGSKQAGNVSEELQGMFATLRLTSDLTIGYGMKSRSSGTASNSAGQLEQEVRQLADQVAQSRQQAGQGFNPMTMMLGAGADRMLGQVETALRSAKGTSSGSVCQVSVTLPGAFVDEAKSLIGMAAMMGGLGGGMPDEPVDFGSPPSFGPPPSFPSGAPGSPGSYPFPTGPDTDDDE
ncbi:MAG: hypothetical protein KF774_00910 [Planctomyces sp.]|nr:hypothetical protein [Planctomyces sp.]